MPSDRTRHLGGRTPDMAYFNAAANKAAYFQGYHLAEARWLFQKSGATSGKPGGGDSSVYIEYVFQLD